MAVGPILRGGAQALKGLGRGGAGCGAARGGAAAGAMFPGCAHFVPIEDDTATTKAKDAESERP